jgi:hypothetical protein
MATFNFSFAPGTSLQQMVGFEIAGRIWATYLTDNVTVNLHVGVSSSLPSNVIGGALPGISANHSYSDIRTRLRADAVSADDQVATTNLDARMAREDFKARYDMFDLAGNNIGITTTTRNFNITRANAKALGVSFTDGATALDGVIMFGSLAGSAYSWSYDFTRSGPAPINSLDFLSTAIHEIGHVLGMVSSIDKPGWMNSSIGGNRTLSTAYKEFVETSSTYTTPLDLFRYSPRTLGTDFNDLSYGAKGGTKYFSIDGRTTIAEFSTGKDTSLGGDGQQSSHWKNATAGIMDPSLAPGARESITALDLRAMDVIGWNSAPNAATLRLDLSTLLGQSQQTLATRLGQTVTWLNANQTTAGQLLAQDRSQAIASMVQNSQVYNWGTTWFNPYRQIVDMMSQQQVYTTHQTLDSMCACTVCHQTAKPDFSEAIVSGTSKSTGWLGIGKLNGRNTIVTYNPQISSMHQADYLISQVASGFDRSDDRLHSVGKQAVPATTDVMEFSGVQLLEVGSERLQLRWDRNLLGTGWNHLQNTSARRNPEIRKSWLSSELSDEQFLEPSFEEIELLNIR